MSVELSKLIDGDIAQRVRFTIRPARAGQWQVALITHHDEQRYDQQELHQAASREDALKLVYSKLTPILVGLLEDWVMDENDLGEDTWKLAATSPAALDDLDVANMVAAAVDDWLASLLEERKMDEMIEAGVPIRWGFTDYETGEFEYTHTEYPGNLTKLVHADGTVEYLDCDGLPVDETGNPLDTES